MMTLRDKLAARLADQKVRIETPDPNTAILWDVPTNDRFFNKSRSNLLVKRPSDGLQYVVCVDDDLEYHGGDPVLLRMFESGETRAGWRTIFLGDPSSGLEGAVVKALEALGCDGTDPAAHPDQSPAAPEGGMIAAFGNDLSRSDAHDADFTIGFEDLIDETASALLKRGKPSLALVSGPSGIGKSHLLRAVGRKLRALELGCRMVSVDTPSLFAGTLFQSDRESLLSAILKEAADGGSTILAFERIDLIQSDTAYGAHLLVSALESGVKLAGTTTPRHVSGLLTSCLRRLLHVVPMTELSCEETVAVLRGMSDSIAGHHKVEIDESCLRSCVVAARDLEGCFPAKAIDLLASASARARVAGSEIVGQDDILVAAKHLVLLETMGRE